MRIKKLPVTFVPKLIFLAVSASSLGVNAGEFNIGSATATLDSNLSFGVSMSVKSPDRSYIFDGTTRGASARISDDGRLNYKSGDIFTKVFKGVHDLDIRYKDSGFFFRGKYWYDFEVKDGNQRFYDVSDSGRDTLQKGSGVYLLDAFYHQRYRLNELQGQFRIGRQVISWGESLLIGNSINSINPIDVSAFRRPGAEIKEGLIPVEMIYLNQALSDSLSLEAFYQLKWSPTIVDNCGTFFSTSDLVADGCNDRLVIAGPDLPPGVSDNTGPGTGNNLFAPRSSNNDARDSGQFGFALRWVSEDLGYSEFGFYALNLHSRAPYLSAKFPTNPNPTSARYFVDYPEDIRIYGLSVATTLGSTSVAGEISYRPNMPLQINGTDLLNAAFGSPISPVILSGHAQQGSIGTVISGYDRREVVQAQASFIHFIDRVLGASRLSLLGEVGVNRISGIANSPEKLRFGRDSLFGSGKLAQAGACEVANALNPENCNSSGYFTTSSWGYRARASLDYSNVFAGINLSPNLAWSHDVRGYGPNFNEGQKALSLGINAEYGGKYSSSLSYTTFFGGDYSVIKDRDFVSLNIGVSF